MSAIGGLEGGRKEERGRESRRQCWRLPLVVVYMNKISVDGRASLALPPPFN